jgi:protein-S-isoprenylcysteine O-methyltransferase Ste14
MAVSVAAAANAEASTTWKRRLSYLQDAALICVSALFLYAHGTHALETGRATNIFFAIEQALLVGMFLTRRRTNTTSQRPWDWFAAAMGGWLALSMRPHEIGGSIESIGVVLQCAGLLLVIVCFLTIGKSFGVVAANRGLKIHGPYRVVRHPIYFSHSLTQLGFVIANPWWPNFAIFAVVLVFQVLRMQAEERVLTETSDYATYKGQVRWRILPGVH